MVAEKNTTYSSDQLEDGKQSRQTPCILLQAHRSDSPGIPTRTVETCVMIQGLYRRVLGARGGWSGGLGGGGTRALRLPASGAYLHLLVSSSDALHLSPKCRA